MASLKGRVTRVEKPLLLSCTWDEGGPEPSELRFERPPEGRSVRLGASQRRLLARELRLSASSDWHAYPAILEWRLAWRPPQTVLAPWARRKTEYEPRIP